jgi:peptidoglycan/LPS O-acetylase OafA/YrhL
MKHRNLELDVLRSIAILLVLFVHSPVMPSTNEVGYGIALLFSALWRGGWIGVDLFFVLSGFLVSGLLYKEFIKYKEINVLNFLVRRGMKIYPAFYFFMLISLISGISLFQQTTPATLSDLLYFSSYSPGIWGHTWSLAIEEHFYFLLAIVVFLLSKIKRDNPYRTIPAIFVGVAIICILFRTQAANTYQSFDPWKHYTPTHLRLDALLFGAVISYYYHFHNDPFMCTLKKYRFLFLVSGVILLLPPFFIERNERVIYTIGYTILYLGSGCLLAFFLSIRLPHFFLFNWLGYIGVQSYSIYLWHVFVSLIIVKVIGTAYPLVTLPLFILSSLFVGTLFSKIIEIPFLLIRDRLFPSLS